MGMNLENFLIGAGVFLFLLMVPVLYRVIIGPTTIDRLVGINVIGTKTTVLLLFIGSIIQRGDSGNSQIAMFVDFALTYALLNFVGTLVVARYYHKKHDKRNLKKGESIAPWSTPQQ
jgi:multicomponent Na+:H+ antiporter subunit F